MRARKKRRCDEAMQSKLTRNNHPPRAHKRSISMNQPKRHPRGYNLAEEEEDR